MILLSLFSTASYGLRDDTPNVPDFTGEYLQVGNSDLILIDESLIDEIESKSIEKN